MIELIYHSEASIAFDDRTITDVLSTARSRNQQDDITGMLFFDGEKFIQILEGSADSVDRLYDSISKDARHRDVSVIYRGQIFERSFSEWRMGYKFTSALTGMESEFDWEANSDLTKVSEASKNPGAQFFNFMNQKFLSIDQKSSDQESTDP